MDTVHYSTATPALLGGALAAIEVLEQRSAAPQPDTSVGILPCPCCGYRAELEQVPHTPDEPNAGGYYIECKRAGCGLTTRLAFSCKDDAVPGLVAAWNRRLHAAPQPAQADEWKQRLIDKLVVSFIYCSEHDTNPEKAINDLLDWEVKAALDPLVSAEARALIEQGKAQADEALALLRRLVKAWDEWVSGGVPQFAEAIVVARAYLEQHK